MTPLETEIENCRLRAEIVELRGLYTEVLEKLGTVAAICGFEPDKALPVIVDQAQMRMGAVPALNERMAKAAAKWIEEYWRATKEQTGIVIEDKTDNSWAKFSHEAHALLVALNRRAL